MPSLNGKNCTRHRRFARHGARERTRASLLPAPQVLVHYGPRRERSRRCCRRDTQNGVGRADAIATDLATADGASQACQAGPQHHRRSPGHPCRQWQGVLESLATIEEMTVEGFSISSSRFNVRAPVFPGGSSCFPYSARAAA